MAAHPSQSLLIPCAALCKLYPKPGQGSRMVEELVGAAEVSGIFPDDRSPGLETQFALPLLSTNNSNRPSSACTAHLYKRWQFATDRD